MVNLRRFSELPPHLRPLWGPKRMFCCVALLVLWTLRYSCESVLDILCVCVCVCARAHVRTWCACKVTSVGYGCVDSGPLGNMHVQIPSQKYEHIHTHTHTHTHLFSPPPPLSEYTCPPSPPTPPRPVGIAPARTGAPLPMAYLGYRALSPPPPCTSPPPPPAASRTNPAPVPGPGPPLELANSPSSSYPCPLPPPIL